MNDFKEKIYNLIVDTSKEEINYENFTRINNQPHEFLVGMDYDEIVSILEEDTN